MNISWIFADGYQLDPTVSSDQIKNVGPAWGSWRTWRSCATDNVICYDSVKAQELIERSFQTHCNFFIPEEIFISLGRPSGVRCFGGQAQHNLDHIEDIVALHLGSTDADVCLLMGFDFGIMPDIPDRFERHKLMNYRGLAKSIVNNRPQTQWVLVDHSGDLDPAFTELPNLTCDTFKNVLQLLAQ